MNKRLLNDLQDHRLQKMSDFEAKLELKIVNEYLHIQVVPLIGTFENNCYQARFIFPPDYPFSPPQIEVISWIPHPNIDKYLFLRTLREWKPTYNIYDILVDAKRTLIYMDKQIVPNKAMNLRLISENIDYSTDEEDVPDYSFLTPAFMENFELPPQQESLQIEEEHNAYSTDSEHEENTNMPEIVNLIANTKQKRHRDDQFDYDHSKKK